MLSGPSLPQHWQPIRSYGLFSVPSSRLLDPTCMRVTVWVGGTRCWVSYRSHSHLCLGSSTGIMSGCGRDGISNGKGAGEMTKVFRYLKIVLHNRPHVLELRYAFVDGGECTAVQQNCWPCLLSVRTLSLHTLVLPGSGHSKQVDLQALRSLVVIQPSYNPKNPLDKSSVRRFQSLESTSPQPWG